MSAPRKYDQKFRERVVRMYRDRLEQGETSLLGARRHVGALLDLAPAMLQNWVEETERARAPVRRRPPWSGLRPRRSGR